MINSKQLGQRIKELRLQHGYRRGDALARIASISDGLLYEIERGEMGERVAFRSVEKIAEALGMTLAELLSPEVPTSPDPPFWERIEAKLDRALGSTGGNASDILGARLGRAEGQLPDDETSIASPLVPQLEVLRSKTDDVLRRLERRELQLTSTEEAPHVHLFGRAAAGLGEYSEPLTEEPAETFPITAAIAALPGRTIALRVTGDSMAPYLREGDVVITWYGEQHLVRERVVPGDLMVVTDGGNEEYVKSVYWDDDAEVLTLTSLNPDYSEKRLAYEDVKWTGLVVAWVKG